jgi:hypothetical protein
MIRLMNLVSHADSPCSFSSELKANPNSHSPAGTLGFADLGIEPDTIEERASVYLRRYRSSLTYEQPVEGSGVKLKKKKYHVID